MRIIKTPCTGELPEVLRECRGAVSLSFADGSVMPLRAGNQDWKLFERMWRQSNTCEVELVFDDPRDVLLILHELMCVA